MTDRDLTSQPGYDPNRLLDHVKDSLLLKNDAALARALEVAPPVISKIRHKRLALGASILVRINEMTDMPIRQMRELMGDRRGRLRISPVEGLRSARATPNTHDAMPTAG